MAIRGVDLICLFSARLELAAGRQLLVAAKLLTHSREHLVGEVILIARGKTFEQR